MLNGNLFSMGHKYSINDLFLKADTNLKVLSELIFRMFSVTETVNYCCVTNHSQTSDLTTMYLDSVLWFISLSWAFFRDFGPCSLPYASGQPWICWATLVVRVGRLLAGILQLSPTLVISHPQQSTQGLFRGQRLVSEREQICESHLKS